MEKAIEIKRRAQRCVQNGDVDGALREYEKLVETPESDPYNFVLLADLLFKKGEQARAAERYLAAVTAYEKAGLYKNGIAVCKKMSRLSLSPALVLKHLAALHALDGLAGEASMYYAQYAEFMTRANKGDEAIEALRKAFELGPDNVKLLEQLSEVCLLEGRTKEAAEAMLAAASQYQARGQGSDARRCEGRANVIAPGSAAHVPVGNEAGGPPVLNVPAPAEEASLEPPPRIVLEPVVRAPEPALVDPASEPAPNGAAPELADERPEPPPAAGVLSASRIPGVTAPSLGGPGLERLEVESGPSFSPGGFESRPMSGLTSTADFSVAAPPADRSGIEQPQAFAAPGETGFTPAGEAPATAEGVYEIGGEESSGYEDALREAQQPGALAPPPSPFASAPPRAEVPTPSVIAQRPEEILGGIANVEGLLQRAQEEFRAGRRDSASQALVEAALAYERLERLDSAATIFRSLSRGANAPVGVMELWLANCEKRQDRAEGSQVACELGDRALNDGHEAQAQRWFEHALAIEPSNETAHRRLLRMKQKPGATSAVAPPAPAAPAAPEAGRVAVAVGRGQAVTFDLQGLLQEFQRGVESQLEGDAQGHYDLGMAYREMGLHDEAILAFRTAERDPRLAQRAREMIGRSFADSGRHEDAVKDFERALQCETLDGPAEAELRYQLAMSLAASGAMGDAMAQMEIADMRFPGRPEIQQRLAEWRRAFGKAA